MQHLPQEMRLRNGPSSSYDAGFMACMIWFQCKCHGRDHDGQLCSHDIYLAPPDRCIVGQHRHQGLFKRRQHGGGNGERELLAETNDGPSVLLDVYLPTWVPEPKQSARDNRDQVAVIVHPCKIRDLRVEKGSPGCVANARRSKRDATDRRAGRKVKLQEERIQFRKCSAQ